jgi:CGNR zinc finger protein/putative stress-induced transcription regulator
MNRCRAYSGHVSDVDLVVDFLNTVDHEAHTDVLDDPEAWPTWLAAHGLTDSADARAVRGALRAAAGDSGAAAAVSVPVTVRLAGGPPRLVAADVAGAVLAAASRLAVTGVWERVKICPADDCRWAFYDRSRNHSRTWCSMQVCGNRQKARAWRRRSEEQLRDRVDQ